MLEPGLMRPCFRRSVNAEMELIHHSQTTNLQQDFTQSITCGSYVLELFLSLGHLDSAAAANLELELWALLGDDRLPRRWNASMQGNQSELSKCRSSKPWFRSYSGEALQLCATSLLYCCSEGGDLGCRAIVGE
jgi:hypothetical protein